MSININNQSSLNNLNTKIQISKKNNSSQDYLQFLQDTLKTLYSAKIAKITAMMENLSRPTGTLNSLHRNLRLLKTINPENEMIPRTLDFLNKFRKTVELYSASFNNQETFKQMYNEYKNNLKLNTPIENKENRVNDLITMIKSEIQRVRIELIDSLISECNNKINKKRIWKISEGAIIDLIEKFNELVFKDNILFLTNSQRNDVFTIYDYICQVNTKNNHSKYENIILFEVKKTNIDKNIKILLDLLGKTNIKLFINNTEKSNIKHKQLILNIFKKLIKDNINLLSQEQLKILLKILNNIGRDNYKLQIQVKNQPLILSFNNNKKTIDKYKNIFIDKINV